jgi:hypothetical protein
MKELGPAVAGEPVSPGAARRVRSVVVPPDWELAQGRVPVAAAVAEQGVLEGASRRAG